MMDRVGSKAANEPMPSHVEDRHDGASTTTSTDAERAFVRKIDMRLVPTVWIMYFFSYLDRSNIGNAYTGGMGSDLEMSGHEYSVALLVFFISYLLFETPSNMFLIRVRPSIYLPTVMFIWGGVSMCIAAIQTWHALAGLRFLLGVLEASFSPGVLFLLSAWYKKSELGRRYSIYYTAVALSGMFGGLIAGGLLQGLDGARELAGWRWLFLIEGAGTCFVSILAFFLLPDFPSTTRWLTPEEKVIASARLAQDNLGDTQTGKDIRHMEALKMALTDWRTWAFVLTYMATTGAQTIQYFIPGLVMSLGYTGFEVQYYTAPIYVCAFVAILAFCFSSDHFQERAWHIVAASALSVVCFAIILGVLDNTGRYVLLCFGIAGVYAACPLVSIYVSNSIPHPSEKRAIAQATVNALGNSASIYGSFLFPNNSMDEHRTGFAVTMVFMIIALVMAIVLRYLLAKYPYPNLVAPDNNAQQIQEVRPTSKEHSETPVEIGGSESVY